MLEVLNIVHFYSSEFQEVFFFNFAYFPWPCMVLYFRRRDKWIGKIISFDDKEVWDVEHSVSVGETCQLRFFWTNVYNLK